MFIDLKTQALGLGFRKGKSFLATIAILGDFRQIQFCCQEKSLFFNEKYYFYVKIIRILIINFLINTVLNNLFVDYCVFLW